MARRKPIATPVICFCSQEEHPFLGSPEKHISRYRETWDDEIHAAEVARDKERSSCRVVETWHLGNFVWALARHPEQQAKLLARAKEALRHEQETRLWCILPRDVRTLNANSWGFH